MAGDIVHFELPAVDPDRAQRFWGSLFGWEFADSGMPGMDYRMARLGDTLGAALAKTDKPQGYPNVYFGTDDIDASLATIRDLGGETEDKSPVPRSPSRSSRRAIRTSTSAQTTSTPRSRRCATSAA